MRLNFKISADHRTRSIVMVDDEELDIEAARRGLRKSSLQNDFLPFADGRAFLDYLATVKGDCDNYPALVLLDINMPLMSGFEVLEAVRRDREFRHIPIVSMLTSSGLEDDQVRARASGANGYLVKPDNHNDYTAFFDSLFE